MTNLSIQVDATAGPEALPALSGVIAKFAADEAQPGDTVDATVLLPEGEQTERFTYDVKAEHVLKRFTPEPAEASEAPVFREIVAEDLPVLEEIVNSTEPEGFARMGFEEEPPASEEPEGKKKKHK